MRSQHYSLAVTPPALASSFPSLACNCLYMCLCLCVRVRAHVRAVCVGALSALVGPMKLLGACDLDTSWEQTTAFCKMALSASAVKKKNGPGP